MRWEGRHFKTQDHARVSIHVRTPHALSADGCYNHRHSATHHGWCVRNELPRAGRLPPFDNIAELHSTTVLTTTSAIIG
jgi:hypothetical protein